MYFQTVHRIEIHDTVLSILKLITKETSHSSTNELRLTRCIYWILEHFCRLYWCVLIAFCLWMYLCVVIFRCSPFSVLPYNRWANNQYTFRLAVWIKTKPFFEKKQKIHNVWYGKWAHTQIHIEWWNITMRWDQFESNDFK